MCYTEFYSPAVRRKGAFALKKRLYALLLGAALLLTACGGGNKPPQRAAVQSGERQFTAPAEGDTIAVITTSLGEVRAVLYPDAAPMAVENFAGLARTGAYDGTPFWRCEYGFAVQGGDGSGTGSGGGTVYNNGPFPLEADGTLCHYAGALCAAFSAQGGTGQFYFVTALPDSVDAAMQDELRQNGYTDAQIAAYAAAGGAPYLDNTDTVFGQVYEGMDIVDQIACAETVKNEDGTDTFRPTEADTVTVESILITAYPGP